MIPTPDYHATHRFARISVRKLRPLLDLIRGHYADDALDVLKYMPHRGARLIEQVLKSAMANAEDKGVRNVGELVIVDARGDGGPMFKRLDAPRPRHGVSDPPPIGAHRDRTVRSRELERESSRDQRSGRPGQGLSRAGHGPESPSLRREGFPSEYEKELELRLITTRPRGA